MFLPCSHETAIRPCSESAEPNLQHNNICYRKRVIPLFSLLQILPRFIHQEGTDGWDMRKASQKSENRVKFYSHNLKEESTWGS
jgi:hypothetical protein